MSMCFGKIIQAYLYAKRRSFLNVNKLPISKGKYRDWGESKSQKTWTSVCKQKSKAG